MQNTTVSCYLVCTFFLFWTIIIDLYIIFLFSVVFFLTIFVFPWFYLSSQIIPLTFDSHHTLISSELSTHDLLRKDIYVEEMNCKKSSTRDEWDISWENYLLLWLFLRGCGWVVFSHLSTTYPIHSSKLILYSFFQIGYVFAFSLMFLFFHIHRVHFICEAF